MIFFLLFSHGAPTVGLGVADSGEDSYRQRQKDGVRNGGRFTTRGQTNQGQSRLSDRAGFPNSSPVAPSILTKLTEY